jgi:hypothetical protein
MMIKVTIFLFLIFALQNISYSSDDAESSLESWKKSCTQFQDNQFQDNNFQGSIDEVITLKAGQVSFVTKYYKDQKCKSFAHKKSYRYNIVIGAEYLNNGFNPKGTYKIALQEKEKTLHGLIWFSSDRSFLRITKGSERKGMLMLDLFKYKKI